MFHLVFLCLCFSKVDGFAFVPFATLPEEFSPFSFL